MSRAEIGRRLGVRGGGARGGTASGSGSSDLKAYSIDKCLDVPWSKRDRHTFESKTLWSPCFIYRCQKTRIDCLCHPRSKNPTPLLGRNYRRNGLCMRICSPKTVQRVVQPMGYHKRIPRRKFNVRPENRPRRVQEHLSWTYEEWKRVLWTGESTFSTAGPGHRPWATRSPEEECHPDFINEIFNQGRESRMVWGGFCGGYRVRSCVYSGQSNIGFGSLCHCSYGATLGSPMAQVL